MPFFLPTELIEFEYLDTETNDKARNYRKEIDLAFFVVNFGFSKSEYLELTGTEKAFIYKEWENKLVRDSQLMHDSVLTAVSNAFRKKGRSLTELWNKKKTKKVNGEEYSQLVRKLKDKDMSSILRRIRNGRK